MSFVQSCISENISPVGAKAWGKVTMLKKINCEGRFFVLVGEEDMYLSANKVEDMGDYDIKDVCLVRNVGDTPDYEYNCHIEGSDWIQFIRKFIEIANYTRNLETAMDEALAEIN